MDTGELEIRRVQPGMYLGQSVRIVNGKAIPDDEESFDNMILAMVSRQIPIFVETSLVWEENRIHKLNKLDNNCAQHSRP